MANGLVDIDRLLDRTGDVLQPHSPDWFSTVCLPYEYQPDADCPRFLAFVREILEDDEERITLLRQWFGYLLAGDTSLQKFLILVGEGANGKTVIIVVLTALLGEANVSTVPLELFGERFQLTATLGKLANLVPEVGAIDRVAEGFLKAFVAGDRMYFDRKNLPGIDARPTARLMLATNTLPPFADRSGGVWRRLMILPFRVTIPPDRQDPHLATTLARRAAGHLQLGHRGMAPAPGRTLHRAPRVQRGAERIPDRQQPGAHLPPGGGTDVRGAPRSPAQRYMAGIKPGVARTATSPFPTLSSARTSSGYFRACGASGPEEAAVSGAPTTTPDWRGCRNESDRRCPRVPGVPKICSLTGDLQKWEEIPIADRRGRRRQFKDT